MLIDAHSHIDHYTGEALETALNDITANRILTLSNAMHPASYRRTLEIAQRCPYLIPSFGVHPWHAAEYADRLEELTTLLEQSPLYGEIGLDYLWVDKTTIPAQQQVFEVFLAAAREQDKIINLHTKVAEADILTMLKKYELQRAIVHWYSGPPDILRQMIEYGLYFTVGVEVLSSQHIQSIAREIPLGQLLTETDNPGAMEWLVNEPGRPADLLQVIEAVAALKGLPPQELVAVVAENFAWLTRDDRHLSLNYPLK
jgi:TatD DNase family protein